MFGASRFLLLLFVLWKINLIDSFTCSTGCTTPLATSSSSSDPTNYVAGQLCTNVSTSGTCTTTFGICNSVSGNDAILEADFVGVPGTQLVSYDPLSAVYPFQCGSDGNWYYGQAYVTTKIYCDMACNPSTTTCPSTSSLPACPTVAPPTNPTTQPTSLQTSPTTKPTSPTTKPTSPTVSCCPVWSAWSTTIGCNDTCGSCGVSTMTRTCLTASSCPCSGSTTRTIVCNYSPCFFPRSSCCPGFKSTIINGTVICGPLPTVPIDTPSTCTTSSPPTACPPGGTWSAWSAGTCSDTCGLCGTLTTTRTCLSAASGCPCSGSSVNNTSQRCGSKTCTFPRLTCCSGATTGKVNSIFACVLSG